jgi:hypothetical protein
VLRTLGSVDDLARAGHQLPGKSWFQLFRLYGPMQPWFDQTWKLNEFELIG